MSGDAAEGNRDTSYLRDCAGPLTSLFALQHGLPISRHPPSHQHDVHRTYLLPQQDKQITQ